MAPPSDWTAWSTPLPDAPTMRAIDRWAIEERGVDGLELMERAGASVARSVERLAADGPVTVVCGKGNNGGDGLVVARLLRNGGRAVDVICVVSPQEYAGDARVNLERLPGPQPLRLDGRAWDGGSGGGDGEAAGGAAHLLGASAVIVDALLGTGFSGEPHGAVAEAILAINAAGAPVISVDVPSGVDASSGVLSGAAVRAARTVTFHAGKPGLWIHPGKACCGEVETADIGIPRGEPLEAAIAMIAPEILDLLPHRDAASTKFSSGHVLVAGGSRGLTGAPTMAALASMRAGAGYVTAFLPGSLQAIVASAATPELMTRGLACAEDAHSPDGVAEVLAAAERGGALVLGPGLGRSESAFAFARELAREVGLAVVIDADALNAHAGRLEELAPRTQPTVLTPHAGELGRLLELDSSEIERERLRRAREAAERARAVVVLKGDDTLVAHPDGRVAVSPGDSPALATAGTGDVLSGVIGALLAQGVDAFVAAAAGVWLHAEAGREAARRLGGAEGVIATDVIAALAAVRSRAASEGHVGRVLSGG